MARTFRALALGVALGAPIVGVSLLVAPPALAQSAADKATARQLARDGIELYQDGKYEEALDRLQRAQALYDAPVHLLFIARTHTKLDQLVDAAEAYRKLLRYEITGSSPQAFKDAVADAEKELPPIEPKIPSLRVDVSPPGVENVRLTIDGDEVPSAVIGVNRPVNPGEHVVEVRAPGYQPAQQTVELAHGKNATIELVLEEDPAAAAGAAGAAAPGDTGAAESGQPSADAGPPKEPGLVGFLVGLRFGAAVPTGEVTAPDGSNQDLKEVFAPGGGGEARFGVRIAKYYTPLLYYERYVMGPGDFFSSPDLQPPANSEVTTTAFAETFGLGFMFGTPRGEFGGFGEIGVSAFHRMAADNDGTGPQGQSCTTTAEYRGVDLRLGGGANLPVWKDLLNLTPYLMFHIGRFSEVDVSRTGSGMDCMFLFDDALEPGKIEFSGDQQKTHGTLVIGVGGDFTFGGDSAR